MSIERTIKDAVAKGWGQNKPPYEHKFITANRYWIVMLDANGTEYTLSTATAIIDPEFWRVLGEVFGWDKPRNGERAGLSRIWMMKWHELIDHLASGKDIEQFFTELYVVT